MEPITAEAMTHLTSLLIYFEENRFHVPLFIFTVCSQRCAFRPPGHYRAAREEIS